MKPKNQHNLFHFTVKRYLENGNFILKNLSTFRLEKNQNLK